MKRILPLFLLFLISVVCNAQVTVFEREVPQAVKKIFIEKYPDVTAAEWYKNNDTVFGAKFSLERKKTTAEFLNTGVFLSSSSEMAPKETPGMISNYIRGNHPDFVVSLSMMKEDAKGKISYYVEIKNPGVGQAITKLWFDFYGNLTKIIEPQEAKLDKDAEEGDNDDLGADIASGQKISKKELPSVVNSYITNHYKDYRFDEAIFVENATHGSLYQVKMRKIGYKDFILVHFNLKGEYVEIEKE